MVSTTHDIGTGSSVDLVCFQCDASLTEGGNNFSLRAAKGAAARHHKRTGHTEFGGSVMLWVKVSPAANPESIVNGPEEKGGFVDENGPFAIEAQGGR